MASLLPLDVLIAEICVFIHKQRQKGSDFLQIQLCYLLGITIPYIQPKYTPGQAFPT